MEKYDYKAHIKEDALNYIKETLSFNDITDCFTVLNDNGEPIPCFDDYVIGELAKKFAFEMYVADSVTGNASGSYTCSTWKAEENLCHNLDLVNEVAEYFEIEPKITTEWEHGAEWWDVNIRVYLLNDVCYEIANDIADELKETLSKYFAM